MTAISRQMFISVQFYLLETISEVCQTFKPYLYKNPSLLYFYYLDHIKPFVEVMIVNTQFHWCY